MERSNRNEAQYEFPKDRYDNGRDAEGHAGSCEEDAICALRWLANLFSPGGAPSVFRNALKSVCQRPFPRPTYRLFPGSSWKKLLTDAQRRY
jgi:hypothetical protein